MCHKKSAHSSHVDNKKFSVADIFYDGILLLISYMSTRHSDQPSKVPVNVWCPIIEVADIGYIFSVYVGGDHGKGKLRHMNNDGTSYEVIYPRAR